MKYIWNGVEWVDAARLPKRKSRAPAIISDIEYRGVGFPGNPWVGSRSTHKDLLKRHGMEEAGGLSADQAKKEFSIRKRG